MGSRGKCLWWLWKPKTSLQWSEDSLLDKNSSTGIKQNFWFLGCTIEDVGEAKTRVAYH